MARSTAHTPFLLDVLSRSLAGLLGGYALSVALPVLVGLLLPVARGPATVTALLLSFLVYTGAFLWAFGVRSHWHAWSGLLFPALLCGGLATLWLTLIGDPAL